MKKSFKKSNNKKKGSDKKQNYNIAFLNPFYRIINFFKDYFINLSIINKEDNWLYHLVEKFKKK